MDPYQHSRWSKSRSQDQDQIRSSSPLGSRCLSDPEVQVHPGPLPQSQALIGPAVALVLGGGPLAARDVQAGTSSWDSGSVDPGGAEVAGFDAIGVQALGADWDLWVQALEPWPVRYVTPQQAVDVWSHKEVPALISLTLPGDALQPEGAFEAKHASSALSGGTGAPGQVVLETWGARLVLQAPCRLMAFREALVKAFQAPHLRFCGHGLWQNTLIDPLGQRFDLRPKEAALLAFLFQSPGANRQEALQQVWGYDEGIETVTLEAHLSSLRQTLEATSHPLDVIVQQGVLMLKGGCSPRPRPV